MEIYNGTETLKVEVAKRIEWQRSHGLINKKVELDIRRGQLGALYQNILPHIAEDNDERMLSKGSNGLALSRERGWIAII